MKERYRKRTPQQFLICWICFISFSIPVPPSAWDWPFPHWALAPPRDPNSSTTTWSGHCREFVCGQSGWPRFSSVSVHVGNPYLSIPYFVWGISGVNRTFGLTLKWMSAWTGPNPWKFEATGYEWNLDTGPNRFCIQKIRFQVLKHNVAWFPLPVSGCTVAILRSAEQPWFQDVPRAMVPQVGPTRTRNRPGGNSNTSRHQPRFSSHCSQAALLRGCPCKSTMWNLGVATSWGKLSRFLLANRIRLLGLVATLVVSQQWSTRRPQWRWRCWGRKQKPGLDRGWDGEGDQRQTGKKRQVACLRSKKHLGCYAVCHVTNWRKKTQWLLSYHISFSYGIPEVTCLFLLSRCLCANPKRPSEKPDTRTTSTTSTWLIGHTLFVSICALAMTTMGIEILYIYLI